MSVAGFEEAAEPLATEEWTQEAGMSVCCSPFVSLRKEITRHNDDQQTGSRKAGDHERSAVFFATGGERSPIV